MKIEKFSNFVLSNIIYKIYFSICLIPCAIFLFILSIPILSIFYIKEYYNEYYNK